jgi:phosphoenolpyruvate carboxylase
MTELFKAPVYQQHLIGRRNHQFVMLGYSASNKEQGSITSQWSLRRAQEALLSAAQSAKVDLTIFHGRGSTSSRNAGLVDVLTRTMPEGMARGRVRMTEQGELLHDKYSLRPIALRVFEQSFNALSLSRAGIRAPEGVTPEWREVMDLMSRVSGEHYRKLVYQDPKFFEFFRLATPVDVIERMQIGSQGTVKDVPVNIDGIRLIPWSYAWAQCRYMLPAWYGAGQALVEASQQFGDELLSQMFARWYFFEQLVNQVEMGLARADLGVATFYDQLAGKEFESVVTEIRSEYELAKQ